MYVSMYVIVHILTLTLSIALCNIKYVDGLLPKTYEISIL